MLRWTLASSLSVFSAPASHRRPCRLAALAPSCEFSRLSHESPEGRKNGYEGFRVYVCAAN